jgi:hypothetical protein
MRQVLLLLILSLLTHLSLGQGVISPVEDEDTYDENPAWEYDLSLTPPALSYLNIRFPSVIKDSQS